MIRLLGILSVILFWAVVICLAPVIILLAIILFLLTIAMAISSIVYEVVTKFLERKLK